jgi:hypothetical protein
MTICIDLTTLLTVLFLAALVIGINWVCHSLPGYIDKKLQEPSKRKSWGN